MTAAAKGRAHEQLRGVSAGGVTNLSSGLLEALDELRRRGAGAVRSVLLLTDGHMNRGVTDVDRLLAVTRAAIGTDAGVGTDTGVSAGVVPTGEGSSNLSVMPAAASVARVILRHFHSARTDV